MKTLTIEINEQSKAGKTILELLELYSKEENGVKILNLKKTKGQPISKKVPNETTLRSMEKTGKGEGVSEPRNLKDFLKEMDRW